MKLPWTCAKAAKAAQARHLALSRRPSRSSCCRRGAGFSEDVSLQKILQCVNSSSSCLEFGFQFGRAVVIACVGGDGVAQSRKQAGVYESTQVLMAMRLFKGFADQTMQWGCGLKREGFVQDICLYH